MFTRKVPRGKWYCHGCISKAPPPKKRGPKKGYKETKESKSNNTSTQSLNVSAITTEDIPARYAAAFYFH